MVVLAKGVSSYDELAEVYSVSDTFYDECCCTNGIVGD